MGSSPNLTSRAASHLRFWRRFGLVGREGLRKRRGDFPSPLFEPYSNRFQTLSNTVGSGQTKTPAAGPGSFSPREFFARSRSRGNPRRAFCSRQLNVVLNIRYTLCEA